MWGWVPPGMGSQGPLSLARESQTQPACLQLEEPFPLAHTCTSPGPSLGICFLALCGSRPLFASDISAQHSQLHLQLCTLSLSTLVLLLPRQVPLSAEEKAAAAPEELAAEAHLAIAENQTHETDVLGKKCLWLLAGAQHE